LLPASRGKNRISAAAATPAAATVAWPRQEQDQRGGGHPGRSNGRQACADAGAAPRERAGDTRERSKGDAVDQPEHHEREAQRAHAGRTARAASYDRHAHRVVEAAREDETDQRRAAVAGPEREGARPLLVREQPSPAVGLEHLGEHEHQPDGREHGRLTAREGP
jgi:hypothetical protein